MKIIIAIIVLLISSTFLISQSFAQVDLTNNFGTIVYQFNGMYYVKDPLTGILGTSDTPDGIIKTALARGGEIYIEGGTYILTKDFSGFDLKTGTHLKLARDVHIVVPSGYKGYAFRFNSGISHCILEGGGINEANPVKRGWIGIMMQGGPAGVYFNLIQNVIITDPYIVIDFDATSGQWINGNTFVNIEGYTFVRGIEFDFTGKLKGGDGITGNTFRDSQFQSGPMTTYGVKDIKHDNNDFYNVQIWDLPPGAISATVDPSAENTIILGGIMTYQGFVDKGVNTIILDAWHNNLSSNSTIASAIVKNTYQPTANIPTIPQNQGLNMSLPQQFTTGFVKGNKAQFSLSQQIPIDINIYGKVSAPRGGSVVLSITGPDGVVEQNQAYVTSDGTFYFPLIFDKNSLIGQYKISGTYQNSNLGYLVINVTSSQTLPTDTSSNPSTKIVPASDSNETLFARINYDARLWSQGKVTDDIFGNTIQYLINIGIIQKPNVSQTSLVQSVHIPTWFKNNAAWFTDGQISYNDFISEIQYLLKNGMIVIPSQ